MSNLVAWIQSRVFYWELSKLFINKKEINMTNFNFNSRETYKTFVIEWKATYKANSDLIRSLKREIKHEQKEGDADKASSLQSKRQYLRGVQNRAISERHKAKEEAQRQWLAEREEAQKAA